MLLDLANLVVYGLPALPTAVSLHLADLHGLCTLPAVVCLANLVGGMHAGMLSSRSLFLECFRTFMSLDKCNHLILRWVINECV